MDCSSESDCFEDCSESVDWTSSALRSNTHYQHIEGDGAHTHSGDCSTQADVPPLEPVKQSDERQGCDAPTHVIQSEGDSDTADVGEELVESVINEVEKMKLAGENVVNQEHTSGAPTVDRSGQQTGDRSEETCASSSESPTFSSSDHQPLPSESPRDEFFIDDDAIAAQDSSESPQQLEERLAQARTLKQQANDQFRAEQALPACHLYTDALRLCPLSAAGDRAVLFSNRAACRAALATTASSAGAAPQSSLLDGDSSSTRDPHLTAALADCARAVQLDPAYERARRRYARLLERVGGEQLDQALEQWRHLASSAGGAADAETAAALQRLPPLIAERNERLKTEMMAKLKDLGNMVLRPFGMSTENFKLQPTESGGYNIQFVQQPK